MLGGAPILAVEKCTDLGVIRISDFSYGTHIRSVMIKVYCLSSMLFRAFSSRNILFKTNLYIAYVRPIVEYASTVWYSSSVELNQEVERFSEGLRRNCEIIVVYLMKSALIALHDSLP